MTAPKSRLQSSQNLLKYTNISSKNTIATLIKLQKICKKTNYS